jgi:hypothetical protein
MDESSHWWESFIMPEYIDVEIIKTPSEEEIKLNETIDKQKQLRTDLARILKDKCVEYLSKDGSAFRVFARDLLQPTPTPTPTDKRPEKVFDEVAKKFKESGAVKIGKVSDFWIMDEARFELLPRRYRRTHQSSKRRSSRERPHRSKSRDRSRKEKRGKGSAVVAEVKREVAESPRKDKKKSSSDKENAMSGHGEAQSEEETKLQLHSEFIYLLNALIDSESPQSIQLSNSMSCNNDSDKQFICGTKNPPPIEHLDISDNFMTEISMSVERKFRKDNGLEPRENISGVASQTIDKDVQYMTAHGKIALLIETSPHLRSLHLRNTGIADSTTKEMHVPLLLKAMDAAKERKSKPESNENRLESLSINCWSIEQEKSEIEIESGRLGLARFSWYDTRMILRLMHFNESITSLDFTQIQGRAPLTSEGDKKVTIEMMRNAVKDLL